ncbi:hypothetical protein MP228_003890 [Amoeboaphelidium protococcarum]|nr:hypothetical protein MP228_003890 [Amoeboaphelidium protococcarum]
MNTRDIKLNLLMLQAQELLVNCLQLLKVDQVSHAECYKFLVVSDRVCARPDVHKFCQTLTLEVDKVISVDLSGFSYSASSCFVLPLWFIQEEHEQIQRFLYDGCPGSVVTLRLAIGQLHYCNKSLTMIGFMAKQKAQSSK